MVGLDTHTLAETHACPQPISLIRLHYRARKCGDTSGSEDAFILKINPQGNALIYSTYFAGNDREVSVAMKVDSQEAAYVAGFTSSTDFPVVGGLPADQAGAPDGHYSPFVAKISPEGDSLVYSTYLGAGDGVDQLTALDIDSDGNAYIAGFTSPPYLFPVIGGLPADQGGLPSGDNAIFVAKLNAEGEELVYSTYISGNGPDFAYGLTVDAAGQAYVGGGSLSSNLPRIGGLSNGQGGAPDIVFGAAYLAKLNADGDGLLYATYLGGNRSDDANVITVDSAGSLYVGGRTSSSNFPVVGGLPPDLGGHRSNSCCVDMFVAKLNPDGGELVYSTYVGGKYVDGPNGIAVNESGEVYLAGQTNSPDFPVVNGLPLEEGGAAPIDAGNPFFTTSCAFVSQLNSAGDGFVFSTYLCGNDNAYALALSDDGDVYVAGEVAQAPGILFPIVGGLPPDQGGDGGPPGGIDGFVAMLTQRAALLSFHRATYSVDEDHGNVTLQVDRTGSADMPASVGFATADGTATAGSDYEETQGTLMWGANDTAPKFITVPIIVNGMTEADEKFTVTLSGGADAAVGTPTVAVVTIKDVVVVNQPPIAVDDTYAAHEDTLLTVNAPGVLSNDSDPDGDALIAIPVAEPTDGTLMLNSDGGFNYTPNAGFIGTDSFIYKANDGQLDSNVATVTIEVDHVNQPPIAANDSYTTAEGTPLEIAAPGMLANDTDPDGDALTAALVGGPSNGTLALNPDGGFVYVAAEGFSGTDNFTYEANDGQLNSNIATVTIKVSNVDQPPIAQNDSYTATENTTLTVSAPGVLGNDSDPDGDTLSAVLVSTPSNGTVAMNSTGSFIYVPNAGFSGIDNFTYEASDGQLHSNIATVTIKVGQSDQPPVAANDSYSTGENTALTVSAPGVLGNDSDPDGDTLSTVLVSAPSNGTLAMNPDGSFIYVPNTGFFGIDNFKYETSDGQLHSNVATVTIEVGQADQPPVAADDSYTAAENMTLTVSAPGVLGNDSDPDGDTLSAVLVGSPSNGTLAMNPDGSFIYVPTAGFFGTDSFTYEANDGQLHSNIATVTIKVGQADQPPVAADDSYTAAENTTLTVSAPGVLGNDSDPDGDTVSAVLVGSPSNGTLAMNPDGSFIYVPTAGFFGTDSFTYEANDGQLNSNPAVVTITIAQGITDRVFADGFDGP
jgi:hypothetical protein